MAHIYPRIRFFTNRKRWRSLCVKMTLIFYTHQAVCLLICAGDKWIAKVAWSFEMDILEFQFWNQRLPGEFSCDILHGWTWNKLIFITESLVVAIPERGSDTPFTSSWRPFTCPHDEDTRQTPFCKKSRNGRLSGIILAKILHKVFIVKIMYLRNASTTGISAA